MSRQGDHEVLWAGRAVICVPRQFGQGLGGQFRFGRCVGGTVERLSFEIDDLNPDTSTSDLDQGCLRLRRALLRVVSPGGGLGVRARSGRRTARAGDARDDLVERAHATGHLSAEAQVEFLEPGLILVPVERNKEQGGRSCEQAEIPSQDPPADGMKNHG